MADPFCFSFWSPWIQPCVGRQWCRHGGNQGRPLASQVALNQLPSGLCYLGFKQFVQSHNKNNILDKCSVKMPSVSPYIDVTCKLPATISTLTTKTYLFISFHSVVSFFKTQKGTRTVCSRSISRTERQENKRTVQPAWLPIQLVCFK